MYATKRLKHIDATRGFAIVCVVIGHVLGKIVEAEGFNTLSPYNILFKFIYSFHMPLFFFLSGVFIDSYLNKNKLKGIKTKFIRLMIPYFIWTFIFVVLKQLSPSLQSNETSWGVFFRSPIDPNPLQYWFLYVLFAIYILYSVLNYVIVDIEKLKGCIFFVAAVLALINPCIRNVWISNYLFKNLVYFSLGTFYINDLRQLKKRYNMFIGVLFLISEIAYFLTAYNAAIYKSYIVIICGITGVIFITYLFDKLCNEREGKGVGAFLSFNGVHSMEIYCIHPIVASVIRIVINRILRLADYNNTVFELILTIAVTIAICDIIVLVLKKSKVFGLLFGTNIHR